MSQKIFVSSDEMVERIAERSGQSRGEVSATLRDLHPAYIEEIVRPWEALADQYQHIMNMQSAALENLEQKLQTDKR